jgi:hypothetical protein
MKTAIALCALLFPTICFAKPATPCITAAQAKAEVKSWVKWMEDDYSGCRVIGVKNVKLTKQTPTVFRWEAQAHWKAPSYRVTNTIWSSTSGTIKMKRDLPKSAHRVQVLQPFRF